MDEANLSQFSAKLVFSFEAEGFIVKTATTIEDLKLALQLRHKVFLEEGLNRQHSSGLEFDDFDHRADHLMIIEKQTGLAVGTYRFMHSDYSDTFYSQGEFHLDEFLKLEGSKLELGRACTHWDHRTGRTMDLLWQGLSKYIRDTHTRYLFGCSSVDSTDPKVVFSIIKSLEKRGNLTHKYNIRPTEKYSFPNTTTHLANAEFDIKVLRSLPPLLRSYLHAGSLVHGFPALDEDFQCTDLLTVLDVLDLNKKFAERYNPVSPQLKM